MTRGMSVLMIAGIEMHGWFVSSFFQSFQQLGYSPVLFVKLIFEKHWTIRNHPTDLPFFKVVRHQALGLWRSGTFVSWRAGIKSSLTNHSAESPYCIHTYIYIYNIESIYSNIFIIYICQRDIYSNMYMVLFFQVDQSDRLGSTA